MSVKIKAIFMALLHPAIYIASQILMQTVTSNLYINTLLAILLYLIINYILNINKEVNTTMWKQYSSIDFKKILLYIVIATVLYMLIVILNTILIDFFPNYNTELEQLVKEDYPFLMILTIGICAPFIEEFIFRGEVYKQLQINFGESISIFVQAIIFAMVHPIALQQIQTFLLGLVLGLVREKSKNLWPSTIIHITSNLIASFLALVIL